ncbi:hypothetical protein BDN72DRAFT_740630, partial [Pluteus cervinus]
LKEHEVNMVCGVYQVFNGDTWGGNTAHRSWWPKPNTWEYGGIWPGYWTGECEAWFQNRLKDIRNGIATLRTAESWKS